MQSRWRMDSAAAIILTWQCVVFAQSPKKVANPVICKVYSNPSASNGTLVSIRAVYGGSFEGSYLFDIKCGKALWFTTPEGNASVAAVTIRSPYPKVAQTDFVLVKDKEYENFTRFAYATLGNFEPEYKVTATFTGRIDRCNAYKLGKDGFGNGFGQMGQSEFQFILKSVSDVIVEEPDYLVAPTRSVLPESIPEKH